MWPCFAQIGSVISEKIFENIYHRQTERQQISSDRNSSQGLWPSDLKKKCFRISLTMMFLGQSHFIFFKNLGGEHTGSS